MRKKVISNIKLVSEFIENIEKIWPNDDSFTLEGILGILMENDYNYDKVINLVNNKDRDLINIIKGKN